MSARRDSSDGPEDIDAAFAEIVADLEQDETFARWTSSTSDSGSESTDVKDRPAEAEPPKPDSPKSEPPRSEPPKSEPPKSEPPKSEPPRAEPAEIGTGPRDWAPGEEEEGHFVPPEPPPLPVPKPATLLGFAIVVLGLAVLLFPGLAGLSATAQLPLSLVLISGGIGWLLFRLRRTPPTDPTDPDDDGAQV
ncbi:hypothetical protein GCM10009854_15640 [Saccharopolyspora halophila]|uniref:DUF308 domain-containing protein n=1 Tax=Saccharopolyspora halophila TaxID=405551 RepID=A0ABP5SW56_9PSEU